MYAERKTTFVCRRISLEFKTNDGSCRTTYSEIGNEVRHVLTITAFLVAGDCTGLEICEMQKIQTCNLCHTVFDSTTETCPMCGNLNRTPSYKSGARVTRTQIAGIFKSCEGCHSSYGAAEMMCPICGDSRWKDVQVTETVSHTNPRESLSWDFKTRLKVRTSTGTAALPSNLFQQ